jgi:hypothetical protein
MSSSTSHFHIGVDFPVYALAWLDDDHVAVTGGGGAGRSGIKNSLVGCLYCLSVCYGSAVQLQYRIYL